MREVPNTTKFGGVWSWLLTAALAAGVSAPASAGAIYAWRTDDGGYAYTDDPKAIPERYRDQVETRVPARLKDYPRYTANNDKATARYADRVEERVAHLRELNGALNQRELTSPEAAAAPQGAPDYITIRTGRRDRGGIDLAVPSGAGIDQAPLTIETVWVRLEGSSVIQPVQVTKRGDKIVAVNKPRARNWNIGDPIDESELMEELEKKD